MWVSSLRGEFRPTSVNIGAKINLFDEKHDTKCKKDDLLTENINKMGIFYKKRTADSSSSRNTTSEYARTE